MIKLLFLFVEVVSSSLMFVLNYWYYWSCEMDVRMRRWLVFCDRYCLEVGLCLKMLSF